MLVESLIKETVELQGFRVARVQKTGFGLESGGGQANNVCFFVVFAKTHGVRPGPESYATPRYATTVRLRTRLFTRTI